MSQPTLIGVKLNTFLSISCKIAKKSPVQEFFTTWKFITISTTYMYRSDARLGTSREKNNNNNNFHPARKK